MNAKQAIQPTLGCCRKHQAVRTAASSTHVRLVRSRAVETQIRTQKALTQVSELPVEKGLPFLGMAPELVSRKFRLDDVFEKHGGPFLMSFNGEDVLCVDKSSEIIEAQTARQNDMEMVAPEEMMRVVHNGRKDEVYPNDTAKPWKAALASILSPSVVSKIHVPLMIPVITEVLKEGIAKSETMWYKDMRKVAFSVSIQSILGNLVPKKDLRKLYQLFTVLSAGALSLSWGFKDGIPGTAYNKARIAGQEIEDILLPIVSEALKDEQALIESGSMLGRFIQSIESDEETVKLMGPDENTKALYFCMEVLVLTFAGTDTTANSLSQIAVQMSKHPEWLELLWQEQQDLMKVYGDEVTPEVVHKSALAAAVGQEVLRLSNSNLIQQRRATTDTVVGDIAVPAGQLLALFSRTAILDTNKAVFDPTHWLRPAESTKSSSSAEAKCPAGETSANTCPYSGQKFKGKEAADMNKLVFGAGPRVCSGQALALSEISTTLVVLSRYVKELKMSKEEQDTFTAAVFPHPTGMPATVVARH